MTKCFLSSFSPEHEIGVLQRRTLKPLWTLMGSMGSPAPTRPKLEFAHWKHDLLWRQFVLSCLVLSCHVKISQITVPAATLLVLLESPSWVWVHQAGFLVFRHLVQELLNIEPFFHWKFNKIKTTFFFKREIGLCSCYYYWESRMWVGFNEGDFITFRPKASMKKWVISQC
jgi:hypothetical protein